MTDPTISEFDRRERPTDRADALDALAVLLGHALHSGEDMEHYAGGIERLLHDQVELLRLECDPDREAV